MLTRLLLRWASNVAALWVAAALLAGVDYGDEWTTLVLAGLVFAVVNWIVRPVVILLSLPLIVLTLGIALFFVNLFMLYLTDWLVGGFELGGFWSAVGATLIVWAVNYVLSRTLLRARVR
jgi:putative membrane protein